MPPAKLLTVLLFLAAASVALVSAHGRHHVARTFNFQPKNVAIRPADVLPPAGDPLWNPDHMADRKEVVHSQHESLEALTEQATHSALHRAHLFAHRFRAQAVADQPSDRPVAPDTGDGDSGLAPPSHLATFKSPAGYVCPSSSSQGLSSILSLLPNAEFACVTTITSIVAPIMTDAGISTLVSQAQSQPVGWSRRNALRVIGDLCWTYGSTGQGCNIIKGSRFSTIQSMLVSRINSESDEDAMNDAIWVMTTYFLPYPSIQSRFVQIANSATFSAAVRFRAMSSAVSSIQLKTSYTQSDINDLLTGLQSSEPTVRSSAAYGASLLPTKSTTASTASLISGLTQAKNSETDIATKAFLLTALDAFQGTQTLETYRKQLYAQLLPNFATGYNGLNISSGMPTSELGCYLTLMNRERNTVLAELGPNFQTSMMVPDKPGMLLIIFATKQAYIDYMGAFIRFGVYAGGLYMNQMNTLFTFQRTSADSIISLNGLVIHEFGHYLHSRFVFQKYWLDNSFFAQPLGWLDEGLAEYWASLNFDNKGCYWFPLRTEYLAVNCPASGAPSAAPTSISTLINLRTGYDLSGVFDYQGGYFFQHFMWRFHRQSMMNIYNAVRAGSYKVANFESLTGLNINSLQTEWNSVFKSWCANVQIYDNDTPTCLAGKTDTQSQCAVYGHGFPPAGAVQYDPSDPNNCRVSKSCGVCERVADNACGWCVDSSGQGSCKPASAFSTAGTCSNTLASTCPASDTTGNGDLAKGRPSTGAKAVDGDDATFWYSSQNPAVWTVDMQSSFYVTRIDLVWRYNSKTRTIAVSNAVPTSVSTPPADSTFTVVKTDTNIPQNFNTGGSVTFATPVKARHIRITLSDHYVAGELNSVKVYAAAGTSGGGGTTTPPPVTVTAPGAPTGVSATAGNSRATVTFTAPVSNGGGAITSYTATSSPGGITGSGTSSPITVTGLTNGVSYTFTVQAANSAGTGAASTASNAVTPAAPASAPGAPTAVTAVAGNGRATVTFTAPASNGGAAITGYIGTANPGSIAAISNGASPSITFTGLTNGVAYTFTVRAINSAGTGAASAASSAVTPAAPTASCAPGTYVSGESCLPCAIGTYSNTTNAASCMSCPTNTTNNAVRSTSCSPCPAGTWGDKCSQNYCSVNPCGTGTCTATATGPSCRCKDGTTGANCNGTPPKPVVDYGCAAQSTCGRCSRVENNRCAWCVTSSGSASCIATTGFTNGTCVNQVNDACQLGDFTGSNDMAANRPSTDAKANDNDDSTYWSSNATTATWLVDLQASFAVSSIVIKQGVTSQLMNIYTSMAAPAAGAAVPADNSFSLARNITAIPNTWNADYTVTFGTPRAARFIKVELSQHHNNGARLNSVQVFAAPGAPKSIPEDVPTETPPPMCNTGSYLKGQACAPCSAGSYNDQPGASGCTACPQNTYSVAGASQCTNCAAGTTTTGTGSTTCVACPAKTSGFNCSVVTATPAAACACSCCDGTTCTPVMTPSKGGCDATCAAADVCPAGSTGTSKADPYNCAAQTSCGTCSRVADNACGWCTSDGGAGSCKPVAAFSVAGTCSNTADDSCPAGDNSGASDLALNKPSSNARVVDGDDATFWYTVASPASWMVDLQSPFNLDSIQVKWRYNSKTRVVAVSNGVPTSGRFPPASAFTTVRSDDNLPSDWNAGAALTLNGAVKARYVMITLSNHYVEAELSTVSVFAATEPTAAYVDSNGVSNFALVPLGTITGAASSASHNALYIGIGVGIGVLLLALGSFLTYRYASHKHGAAASKLPPSASTYEIPAGSPTAEAEMSPLSVSPSPSDAAMLQGSPLLSPLPSPLDPSPEPPAPEHADVPSHLA